MRTRRLLPIALAGLIGTSGGVSVAPAQPTAKPAIVKPTIVSPTETKPSNPQPMTFFVATGEADACGSGCEAWIAADGKIDLDTAQRLRKLFAKLGRRRLPIFLHSGGGSVLGAIELGRLIRSRNIEVSVARTTPTACSLDRLSDKSCEMLKRSGKDLVSELDSNGAMCNSACVLTLSRGAAIAAATRAANSRIVEFLRDMGINKALFDTSNSVPHESTRFLQRDELMRFGIDTREFGETDWRFVEKPNAAIAKGFFARSGEADPAHPEALLKLNCGAGKAMRLTLARERSASNRIAASSRPLRITVNGSRIDLLYATPGGTIEMRTTVLWPNVIDSANDKGAIEISGFGPERDNEPRGRIILNMAGFSAAYAKLRKACDESSSLDNGCGVGDLSARCMPDALRTRPVMPPTAGGQTAWPSR